MRAYVYQDGTAFFYNTRRSCHLMCRGYEIMSPVLPTQTDLPTLHPIIPSPTHQSPFLKTGWAPPLWLWSLRPHHLAAPPCDVPFPGPSPLPDAHHSRGRRPRLQAHHLCSHLHGPRYLCGPTPVTRGDPPTAPCYLYGLTTLPPSLSLTLQCSRRPSPRPHCPHYSRRAPHGRR